MPIRAALDLGSSQHKLIVAITSPSHPPTVLFSHATSVPLSSSALPDGSLPSSVLSLSLSTLIRYRAISHSLKAFSICAVATHALRTASNGPAHLAAIHALGIKVLSLSQHEEGVLAFRSALVADPTLDPRKTVVWDSGGGSTQWTFMRNGQFCTEGVQLGSGLGRKIYFGGGGIRGVKRWIQNGMQGIHIGNDGQEDMKFVGVGGNSCMFAIAKKWRKGDHLEVTRKQVSEIVVERRTSKGFPEREVPKMVMMAGMMDMLGIESVRYVFMNGSCLGLLASDEHRFWGRSGGIDGRRGEVKLATESQIEFEAVRV